MIRDIPLNVAEVRPERASTYFCGLILSFDLLDNKHNNEGVIDMSVYRKWHIYMYRSLPEVISNHPRQMLIE